MNYKIQRECWNEKTFNGFTDSPYWKIEFGNYIIGLKDDGEFWSIKNGVAFNVSYIKETLTRICKECKLNIKNIRH